MWVDNFLRRCAWTIAVMFTHWYHTATQGRILVGADVALKWEEKASHHIYAYVSFSAPPVGDELDDFGIDDDAVFRYLSGVRDIIRIAWQGSDEGWRIAYSELIYASPVESI
jgi:hypothetical protein